MMKNTKVNASILIIGNEILSGRTQDTNTKTIALWLNSLGVNLREVRVIPDIESTIIETINHFYTKLPILGICLGHQSIGAAFGGKIIKID